MLRLILCSLFMLCLGFMGMGVHASDSVDLNEIFKKAAEERSLEAESAGLRAEISRLKDRQSELSDQLKRVREQMTPSPEGLMSWLMEMLSRAPDCAFQIKKSASGYDVDFTEKSGRRFSFPLGKHLAGQTVRMAVETQPTLHLGFSNGISQFDCGEKGLCDFMFSLGWVDDQKHGSSRVYFSFFPNTSLREKSGVRILESECYLKKI